jgi:hypothetical protein
MGSSKPHICPYPCGDYPMREEVLFCDFNPPESLQGDHYLQVARFNRGFRAGLGKTRPAIAINQGTASYPGPGTNGFQSCHNAGLPCDPYGPYGSFIATHSREVDEDWERSIL